jgi:HSP20 family protein
MSVSEDKNHVYIEAHLPGLKTDDIELSFERGVLWIKGEKKEEVLSKSNEIILLSRSGSLPD